MKADELRARLGSKKQKTISELKHLIATRSEENPNYCLFLGAGASKSSGIRTGEEMVREWRESVYRDLSSDAVESSPEKIKEWLTTQMSDWYKPNAEYGSLIERKFPLPSNRRKFIETEVSEKIPSIGYAYLVRLAESGYIRTIFTTNFDDLLNEAFYQLSAERALVCAHDSSVQSISITSRRAKIIKLHGDYLFDALKNTPQETVALEDNMREKFTEFLKEYGLIIAGYSGSDRSIMRILEELSRKSTYLQNGLYWCFREKDEVTSEALAILEQTRSFFVIVPGFDEMMADLYMIAGTKGTPFNSKLASDRASKIIETYLSSVHLKSSRSEIIRSHLDALEAEKKTSLLTDMMREINSERFASAGLTDEKLLVCLEIERELNARNPDLALKKLAAELGKALDQNFKGILLNRRLMCALRLNMFSEAKDSVKELLQLEPENVYIALSESSLIEKRSDRIEYLENLKQRHPFCSDVLNEYAQELSTALERGEKVPNSLKSSHVEVALKQSVKVKPSLSNGGWSLLFEHYRENYGASDMKKMTAEIVSLHLDQNAYDARSSRMLFRFCREFETTEFDGKQLFQCLEEAYRNHFPRDYAAHLDVLVDASIEFNQHSLLRPLFDDALTHNGVKDDPDVAMLMVNVLYDVCRNLPAAIEYGEKFLKTHKAVAIEVRLVDLYLADGRVPMAREMLGKLRGAIDYRQLMRLEVDLLAAEAKYQDAIDLIERTLDRRDFADRFTTQIAYLELKMGTPERARKRCKEYLDSRAFALGCETAIINYELAKKMVSGKVDIERVNRLAGKTESALVKGVCASLLGDDKKALSIFQEEAEKRFSKLDLCMGWPAVARHELKLKELKEDLLKRRRNWADFV